MSPFMTWFSDNLGIILVGGFLVATVALLWGAIATWRTARKLRTPPRPLVRFLLSLVLVNVWATWCPPCRAEMADLDRLQKSYADEGLVVLHLSDEDRDTLLKWLEKEPSSTLHAYAQPISWPETGRPTSYVLDREGIVRRVLLGQRSYDQFEAEIMDLL